LLAVLTAACGTALIVMLWRRRQAASDQLAAQLAAQIAASQAALSAEEPADAGAHRLIDDYAVPIALAPMALAARAARKRGHRPSHDADDSTASKICPACGSRYGHQYRTCSRDDSELAALN
jgi:hypothetical protein